MAGLTLQMSLTKCRAEYYLIKRKSISHLRVKTSSLVSFHFSDWVKRIDCLRMRQYAYTCIDKYLLDHSQYVHSKLLELISHFCVNFLVNPPGRQITPYYISFFQNTSV